MGNRKKKIRAVKYFVGTIFVLGLAIYGIRHFWLSRSDNALIDIRFETVSGPSDQFKLEIVNSPSGRTRGLMFRKNLDSNRGMIFVFPEDQDHSFFMKNTYVSLDIIFIDKNMKVVGILQNLPILNEQSRTIGKPSRFVVELVAGTAERINLKPGDKVILSGILPSAT